MRPKATFKNHNTRCRREKCIAKSTYSNRRKARMGICVLITEEEYEQYALIDRKLIWYGGMSLFGKSDVCDNLIRVAKE